jgi:hypothetical protein
LKRRRVKRQHRRLSEEERRAIAKYYAEKLKYICDNVCYGEDIEDAIGYARKLAKILATIPRKTFISYK